MDFCEADAEGLGAQYVRPDRNPNGIKGVDYFHGEDELMDYYTAALKGPSAAAAQAPSSLPAATPAAAAPTTSAATRTSPTASSARTPHATVRKSPAKQRRKPQKAAATGKGRISSRVKLHSDEEELSEASPDDADFDEEKPPVPSALAASATGNTVPQPAMPVGRQAQDEDGADFVDEGGSIADSAEENEPYILADTTDNLNVDDHEGRESDYDALDFEDDVAKDDVVTDTKSEEDDWQSDASDNAESEPDPERDEMDIAMAKEYLDQFGGADTVLPGTLHNTALQTSRLQAGGQLTNQMFMLHIAISSNKYQRDMLQVRVDDAYKDYKRRWG
ncbi:hypothetical protein PC123_g13262 [Phytophthora cactorum]|nr:hypothetical protein PC123_g13262 [Phytophthora cactorum]